MPVYKSKKSLKRFSPFGNLHFGKHWLDWWLTSLSIFLDFSAFLLHPWWCFLLSLIWRDLLYLHFFLLSEVKIQSCNAPISVLPEGVAGIPWGLDSRNKPCPQESDRWFWHRCGALDVYMSRLENLEEIRPKFEGPTSGFLT